MPSTHWIVAGGLLLTLASCATPNKHPLKVETNPPAAMVSLSATGEFSDQSGRTIAGAAPFEKNFDFGETNRLWLEVEKRGYRPEVVAVAPESRVVNIQLKRLADEKSGQSIRDYALPTISRLLLVQPEFKIIDRKFGGESVAEADSQYARNALMKAVSAYFSRQCAVTGVDSAPENAPLLKSLWRDTRGALELTDPIRLPYFSRPPYLETGSSRDAARRLGEQGGGQVLLCIAGKQNRESAGLAAGKIGLTVAGTAVSYAGAYSRALERGDSFFVYNIYTPSFANGTQLSAALIDSASGEILWLNKGLWGTISFDDSDAVQAVVADLFSNLREMMSKGEKR